MARAFATTLREMLGFRGRMNLAAWVVAGGAAYVLWIRPEQQARQQQQEEWATRVAKYKEIDRARPIPDAQDTGLIKGRRE